MNIRRPGLVACKKTPQPSVTKLGHCSFGVLQVARNNSGIFWAPQLPGSGGFWVC